MTMPQMGLNIRDVDTQSQPIEHDDPGKWELDTDPWVSRIYHDFLGETLNAEGVYQRDDSKNRTMNELGASDFISEIQTRVSIHMQFSELTEAQIIEIYSRAAEGYANKMEDSWEKWELDSSKSNLDCVANSMVHLLQIALNIALKGGMKTHREHVKSPRMMVQQPEQQPGGII